MHKQIVEYTSPPDALVALAKQLNSYETQYQTDSAEFFTQYSQGQPPTMKTLWNGLAAIVTFWN